MSLATPSSETSADKIKHRGKIGRDNEVLSEAKTQFVKVIVISLRYCCKVNLIVLLHQSLSLSFTPVRARSRF